MEDTISVKLQKNDDQHDGEEDLIQQELEEALGLADLKISGNQSIIQLKPVPRDIP